MDGIINMVDKRLKVLIFAFADGEQIVVCIEVSTTLLLHVDCCQGLPHLQWVILDTPEVHPLGVLHHISHMIHTSSFVCFYLPCLEFLLLKGLGWCADYTKVSYCITDIHIISPPTSPSKNLQEASRTTGGFSHGHALGNTFNMGDAPDYKMGLNLTLAVLGKVYIYDSHSDFTDLDPTIVKPFCILKTDVSRTLAPVLTKLARKYSPVHSMFNSTECL